MKKRRIVRKKKFERCTGTAEIRTAHVSVRFRVSSWAQIVAATTYTRYSKTALLCLFVRSVSAGFVI